ncbi:MAG: xanthine dehydrogenase family protein subunit M [Planctomycetes bacterium]|nr:xanthine dehydrogenase family protein subunit M [Planctomycetota bacterium]
MRDFDYEAPASVAEAVKLLSQHNGSARPLAGGTDLIDQIRLGRHTPQVVIDIKKIPELSQVELSATGLRLGAAVPCFRVYGCSTLSSTYAALADSARIIGGIQIQSRASIGGNLCNSGPAADSIPSLIALGAVAVIAGPKGQREVPVENFCTGPGKNVLAAGEFLVELKFPARPANSGSHYRRFIPRNEMDIAVVGVGASVVLDASGEKFVSARVGLGAVGPTPIYATDVGAALAGQPVNDATLNKAAEVARATAKPIDDMRGTKEFRMHITGVLTRRVLEEAVKRAKG